MDPTIVLFAVVAVLVVSVILGAIGLRIPTTVVATIGIVAALALGIFVWNASRGTAVAASLVASGGVALGALAIALAWRSKQKPPVVAADSPISIMAVVGFVLAFVASIAGLVVSYIGVRDVRRNRKRGYGLAVAGVVIAWASVLTGILLFPVLAQWLLISIGVLRW